MQRDLCEFKAKLSTELMPKQASKANIVSKTNKQKKKKNKENCIWAQRFVVKLITLLIKDNMKIYIIYNICVMYNI